MKQALAFMVSLKLKVMGIVLLSNKAFVVMEMKEVKEYFVRCQIKWLMYEVKKSNFVQ